MGIGEIFTLLTRPVAMFAAIAGIVALSIAFVAARRAHRRRAARKAAEKRCRQLVGQMRRCPKLRRPQDRRLADKFIVELDAIVKENGFPLHEIGTSRAELDRIIALVHEDERENPFMKRLAAAPSGRPARAEGSGVRAIVLPVQLPEPAPVLSEATFSEADFPPPDGGPIETIDVVIEEELRPPEVRQEQCNDPITALRSLDDGGVDAFVEDRFAAIVNDD